jgi:hypothetical protein
MKRFFTKENIARSLITMAFYWAFKYLLFYFFGITVPNPLIDPLNKYRILLVCAGVGFSSVLNKVLNRFFARKKPKN